MDGKIVRVMRGVTAGICLVFFGAIALDLIIFRPLQNPHILPVKELSISFSEWGKANFANSFQGFAIYVVSIFQVIINRLVPYPSFPSKMKFFQTYQKWFKLKQLLQLEVCSKSKITDHRSLHT